MGCMAVKFFITVDKVFVRHIKNIFKMNIL